MPITHHIWCNFSNRPVEGCKQCQGLWEKYPYNEDEMNDGGLSLGLKHFPEAVPVTSTLKDALEEKWNTQ